MIKKEITARWIDKHISDFIFTDEDEGREFRMMDNKYYLVFNTEEDFLFFKVKYGCI